MHFNIWVDKLFELMQKLCHPDGRKSCAACCGLYNFLDHSRQTLQRLLFATRALFSLYPLTEEGLRAYSKRARELFPSPPLCQEVYICEFLGFVDPEGRLPGCLIHPELHGGLDLRDVSFYGKGLCEGHLCLGHYYLNEDEKAIIIELLDDWYLYGLLVTDIDYVKGILGLLADKVGEALKPRHLAIGVVREGLLGLFELKRSWPFKDKRPRLGKYWFSYGEYRIAHPWDGAWDRVLGCLETDPSMWKEAGDYLLDLLTKTAQRISKALGGS